MNFSNKKTLITYYSRSGENYMGGKIVNLDEGNTEVAAKKIKEMTGADIFEIDTVKSYPNDYTETTRVALDELSKDARPELTETVADMDSYEIIILAYPNWWGTMPMGVFTFLEAYDFSDKIIIPLCTHEGSGLGRSEKDIKKLCPKAKVANGLAVRGGNVDNADEKIKNWLKSI